MNSRLDELQAALLVERLKLLDACTRSRRAIAARYDAAICHPRIGTLAPPVQAESHVHHLYVLRCADRAALQAHLAAKQVQTLIHYPVPVHHQLPCKGLRTDPEGLPQAELHAAHCLSIPCHPYLSDTQVDQVIAALNSL